MIASIPHAFLFAILMAAIAFTVRNRAWLTSNLARVQFRRKGTDRPTQWPLASARCPLCAPTVPSESMPAHDPESTPQPFPGMARPLPAAGTFAPESHSRIGSAPPATRPQSPSHPADLPDGQCVLLSEMLERALCAPVRIETAGLFQTPTAGPHWRSVPAPLSPDPSSASSECSSARFQPVPTFPGSSLRNFDISDEKKQAPR